MNKDNKTLNDKEIEAVTGGTDVGGVCGPNYPAINKNEYSIGSHHSPDTDTVCISDPTFSE